MTYFSSNKQIKVHKRKMHSEKMAESKIKELNIHLRQQRLINRNLIFELKACKKLLDEQKREKQSKSKNQNKG